MNTTCNDVSTELIVFLYWTRNSMNNILSHCGLVDTRISASEKKLPVLNISLFHLGPEKCKLV